MTSASVLVLHGERHGDGHEPSRNGDDRRPVTVGLWLSRDGDPDLTVEWRTGNLIDANEAELMRCRRCNSHGLAYLPLRSKSRRVALVVCRQLACLHCEEL